jgi:hypothetical protein
MLRVEQVTDRSIKWYETNTWLAKRISPLLASAKVGDQYIVTYSGDSWAGREVISVAKVVGIVIVRSPEEEELVLLGSYSV